MPLEPTNCPDGPTLPPRQPRDGDIGPTLLPRGASDTKTIPPSQGSDAAVGNGDSRPVVPGYEILSELGRGGMGVVYRARQIGLNRLVALKMILTGSHAGAENVNRFRTEAQAIAELRHPNIVQVYEIGDHDGLPYFSLEFCEGGSLANDLRGEPQPPKDAAFIVERLARAIDCAHGHKILHRDLKPANVLLTADGELKITDFGLAKRLDVDDGRTGTGMVLGTPSYMAPEQVNGSKSVGPAADIYALGAILYELLTGRPPFKATTHVDTMLQVVSEEPIPPKKLVPKTPSDLDTICLKCLSKNPRDRYSGAAALADDLAAFQAGNPIAARRVSDWERIRRWVLNSPWTALLIAGALLLALTVSGLSIFLGDVFDKLSSTNSPIVPQTNREPIGTLSPTEPVWSLAQEFKPSASRQWSLAIDPTKGRVAVGMEDGGISIFDSSSGEEVRKWLGHTDTVMSLAFRPDRVLVSGGADGALKIWNVENGNCEKILLANGAVIRAVAFDSEGRWLAVAGMDRAIHLYDTKSWEMRTTLTGPTRAINSVAFSPDGKLLVATSDDCRVRVWSIADGKQLPSPPAQEDRMVGAVFDPIGQSLYAAGWGAQPIFWKLPAIEAEHLAKFNKLKRPTAFAFAPKTAYLAVVEWDGTISFLNIERGVQAQVHIGMKATNSRDFVTSAAFSADGKILYTAGWGRTVGAWKLLRQ